MYRKIEEMYRLLDNYHNQLNANKEKFEKAYNENISSWIEIRNIILTIITAAAGLTVAIEDFKDKVFLESPSMWVLIILGIIGFGVYIYFHFYKMQKKKILSDILKEFYDGFTTISFMKSFLAIIPSRVNLETKQLEELEEKQKEHLKALENYYIMVRGGIVFKIRKQIETSTKIKEEDVYGDKERSLYKMLICNAYQRYKDHKGNEKEKKLIDDHLFKDEKDDINIFKSILNMYKDELEDKDKFLELEKYCSKESLKDIFL